VVIELK